MLHSMSDERVLKQDLFGEVRLEADGTVSTVVRDTRGARWWLAPLARWLMRREAAALATLDGIDGVPELVAFDRHTLRRAFLDGQPMHIARPRDPLYFRAAARLLRRLHRAGVCHNDLAKEPNLLVRPDGSPALIDFQLATCSHTRHRLFRAAAREDIRHLLKHKRQYLPGQLTQLELDILARPAPLSRLWMSVFKPVYLFITRRLLGWADREGAGDRRHER